MNGRPIVVDMHEGPKAIDACPGCGASFAWVRRGDLREVAFDWRAGGVRQHPTTFELRCRDCQRLAVVFESSPGVFSFVPDQAGVTRHVRDRARDEAARRFDGGERGRPDD